MPPADAVLVPKLTLRMSHRMWWFLAETLKFGESPVGRDASIAEAGVPLSHPRATLISATPARPAFKVRACIECSSLSVCFLLGEFTPRARGRSSAQAGYR